MTSIENLLDRITRLPASEIAVGDTLLSGTVQRVVARVESATLPAGSTHHGIRCNRAQRMLRIRFVDGAVSGLIQPATKVSKIRPQP